MHWWIEGQFLYFRPSGLGGLSGYPVAFRDRRTGRIYSLDPYLSNETATTKWQQAEGTQRTLAHGIEGARYR